MAGDKGAAGGQGRSGAGKGSGATGGRRGTAIARGGQGGRAGKPGSHRKGAAVGSGGQRRRALEGRGATPPAEQRTGHPAARRSSAASRREAAPTREPAGRRSEGGGRAPNTGRNAPETVAGRNAVVEALRAGVPAMALYVGAGMTSDERVTESVAIASAAGVALLEVSRHQLDRMTNGALHQGLALQVPPYEYTHPDDLLARAREADPAPLLVALDGVTDPRNLGAVIRSAAAFGAHGVIVPERRAAGLTAAAWKASAGAAARLPVARATNLVRVLTAYRGEGLFVAGLSAAGAVDLDDLEVAIDPLVVVVGSEGRGLSRLVEQTCDLTVRISMASGSESLNAGIAAAVMLAEVARRRRGSG